MRRRSATELPARNEGPSRKGGKAGDWQDQVPGDADADDQLSTYALALARGAVRDPGSGGALPAASRLTLYFTVRIFQADWPVKIDGDEHGDVEYAITRDEWLAAEPR